MSAMTRDVFHEFICGRELPLDCLHAPAEGQDLKFDQWYAECSSFPVAGDARQRYDQYRAVVGKEDFRVFASEYRRRLRQHRGAG